MIHKVRIKNFKAIHDTGELKLTDLNALIGNNGTGKSSIIEAMEVLQIVVATGDVTKAFFKYGSNLSEYLLKIFQDTITRDNIISKMEYILPYISDIRPALVQDTIRKIFLEMTEKNSSFRIPGWLLSSGTLRILNLLSILSAQDLYPIIFIEEIENGLDPKTIHFLIEEIRNFLYDENKQVVFTSHSPYLLDLLHISHIIVVEKDKSNQTRFYRPNRKKIKEWSKQFAPGKLYTMGSLKKIFMKRLGIILECGPYGADRQVIEFLIGRIRTDIQCIYKPLDNKKKLESDCGMTAKSLIDIEKCDYVLIIWDLYSPWKDKKEKPCRHEDKEKIFKALKDAIVSEKKVILICIEAELESWLIADHEALTNYIRQRKNPHVLQNEIKKYKSPDKILNIRNHFH